MIKNIGFYGQSNCAYTGENSYLTMVADYFNAKIVNTGVRQGSEERILFELKKTKNIDFAFIFHSEPSYLFLPGADRDFDITGLVNKKANYIWSASELDKVSHQWNYHKLHHAKFIEKFDNANNFKEIINSYKDYFYDPDLAMNRFYGSIIQIDQYLTSKRIPSLHVIENKKILPAWYNFESIVFDDTLLKLFRMNFSSDRSTYVNGLTIDGNVEISKYLINTIAACGREVHTLDVQSRDGGSNPPAAPIL